MGKLKASKAWFKRAKRVLVGGVNSPVRAFNAVGGTPRFMRAGRGAYTEDIDGNEVLDFCGSWGPLILGHGRREVLAAAAKALKKGSTFGAPTTGEVLMAEKIRKALPSMELVRLTSSGTEAVMSAVRVARGYTKRDIIVKFAGCYHGHVDSLLVQAGSGALTLGSPDSAGVPRAWAATTLILPYNDPKAVSRAFAKYGRKIAALIVEPVVGNMGNVHPKKGFLQHLRKVTKRYGSLLIFDEVITGFRLCYGGAQTYFKIKPDLTTIGKIVGGGFPLAAYGGRRDIMSRVAPLGPVYQAGTLSGNPVAVAAGLETLRLLEKERPYKRLEKRTRDLVAGIREEARRAGVPVTVNTMASMFTVFFTDHPVYDLDTAMGSDTKRYAKFFHNCLDRGLALPPAQFEAAFVSAAHTERDIKSAVEIIGQALRAL